MLIRTCGCLGGNLRRVYWCDMVRTMIVPGPELKTCTECNELKPLDEFYYRKSKSAWYPKCKICTLAYNKGPGRVTRNRLSREANARRRALLAEYKDVPCTDCGVTYPSYVMDFDHRDSTRKEFTLAESLTLSLKRLLAEIEKCDVVCANCHRERTYNQREQT